MFFSIKSFPQLIKKTVGAAWKKLPPGGRAKIVRLTQTKFTVSVAAIITNQHGEILLLDHVLRPFSNWGIPGGFVEASEQPEAAIERETREETGLQLKDVRMVRVRTTGRHVEILFRAAGSGKAEAKSREINRAAWFSPEDIPPDLSRKQKTDIEQLLAS